VLGREDCLDFLGGGCSGELGRQRLQQPLPIEYVIIVLDRPDTLLQHGLPVNLQASFPPEERR
jgi:hypothetical protein